MECATPVLGSSRALEALVGYLESRPLDEMEIVRLLQRKNLTFPQDREGTVSLRSAISELHLEATLERFKLWTPFSLDLDPVKCAHDSKNYSISRGRNHGNDSIIVARKENEKMLTEYDALVLLDGMPVVFEVKLCNPGHRGFGNIRRKRNKADMNPLQLMREEIIREYVLDPLQELYPGSGCGYALVIYPDQVTERSLVQNAFTRLGGQLVRFYADRATYFKDVDRMRIVYGI